MEKVMEKHTKQEVSDDAVVFWILLIVFLIIGFWLCIPCLFCCFPPSKICPKEKTKVKTVQNQAITVHNC